MKICITSKGKDMDSEMDPRFGRCDYFLIIDSKNDSFESISNENAGISGGAGIKAGQLMSKKDVSALITGNLGPNAFETLQAAGIQMYTGLNGKVEDILMQYKEGKLTPVKDATVESHFGL